MINIKKIIAALKSENRNSNIPEQLHYRLLAVQRKVADHLNRKTAGWSPRKTKWVLIVFCLIAGNISLYITGKAVLSANGPPKAIKVQRPSLPGPVNKPGSQKQKTPDSISNKYYP